MPPPHSYERERERELERERWRGEIRADVDSHEEELRKLWDWHSTVNTDMAVMKTKLTLLASLAALVGSIFGGAVAAAITHAINGQP